LGSGLGTTVTYHNSIIFDQVTTKQFEWGYLEMLIELGLFGVLSFLSIIIFTIVKLIKKIHAYVDYHDFDVGLLAGLIAFLIMTITSPALFHIFGIIYLIFVLTYTLKPITIFDRLIQILYRIFNRLRNPNGVLK